MESSITEAPIESLIPVLSPEEKEAIMAYLMVAEKYAEEMSVRGTEELKDHPIFGQFIKDVPKEVSDARSKLNRDLQKDAVVNDNWRPYIAYQIEQGIIYAKMGLDFKSWYEVIGLARRYIMPYLHLEYGNGEKFLEAMNGMNKLLDVGMSILGEAYMQEKRETIKQANDAVTKLNEELEEKVHERTRQLEAANKELESFTYSVSHDLRAPLRGVNGYAQMLVEDYGPQLDEEGKRIIAAICSSAAKMGTLIDELLAFSQLGRKEIKVTTVEMNALTDGVAKDISKTIPHSAKIKIGQLHPVLADYGLLYQVMFNLIGNAVKYSSKKPDPVVEIASEQVNDELVFSVKDNGSGFDMRYVGKLFGVFQRLHSQEEFEGSGVGLAIVQRIVSRHGGRVWAEGKVDEGAVFYFSLKHLGS